MLLIFTPQFYCISIKSEAIAVKMSVSSEEFHKQLNDAGIVATS